MSTNLNVVMEEDIKPDVTGLDEGLKQSSHSDGILVRFEGACVDVTKFMPSLGSRPIQLTLTIRLISNKDPSLIHDQVVIVHSFTTCANWTAPAPAPERDIPEAPFDVSPFDLSTVRLAITLSYLETTVFESRPLYFDSSGTVMTPVELRGDSSANAFLNWRAGERSAPAGRGYSLEHQPIPTLQQVEDKVQRAWEEAEYKEKVKTVKRTIARTGPRHPLPRRPQTHFPASRMPAPFMSDVEPAEGNTASVPNFTYLDFAPVSVPTRAPIVDAVPALEDSVWADDRLIEAEGEPSRTQLHSMLHDVCQIRQIKLGSSTDGDQAYEETLAAKVVGMVGPNPSPDEREFINEVCLHGSLGQTNSTVVDKAVFELKDPARVRRDFAALAALLDTFPTERVEAVKTALARSDPIEDRVLGKSDLSSHELNQLKAFERITRVSAHETFRLAQLGLATQASSHDPETFDLGELDSCNLCGAPSCQLHFGLDGPSPNVPTGKPSSRKTRPAKPVGEGPLKIGASLAYQPCSHGRLGCYGTHCTCIHSKVWCDKFCGCAPDCPRRFRGCDCAAKGKPCSKKAGCPCSALSRECDPALCSTHDAGEGEVEADGFCGNNHFSVGKVAPTEVGNSTSPGAGLGLFAITEIVEGDFLGLYGGEHFEISSGYGMLMTLRERRIKVDYDFNDNQSYAFGSARAGNHVRFINTKDWKGPGYNCLARPLRIQGITQIGIYASARIEAGEEIFLDYGEHYERPWSHKWRSRMQKLGRGDELDASGPDDEWSSGEVTSPEDSAGEDEDEEMEDEVEVEQGVSEVHAEDDDEEDDDAYADASGSEVEDAHEDREQAECAGDGGMSSGAEAGLGARASASESGGRVAPISAGREGFSRKVKEVGRQRVQAYGTYRTPGRGG